MSPVELSIFMLLTSPTTTDLYTVCLNGKCYEYESWTPPYVVRESDTRMRVHTPGHHWRHNPEWCAPTTGCCNHSSTLTVCLIDEGGFKVTWR